MKGVRVLHIPCYHKKGALEALERNIALLSKYDRIGLVSTAQHANQLQRLADFIQSKGKEAHVGGQVLGCNQEAAFSLDHKVDAFLYVGSGLFHPLGISAKAEKPVIILNPYSGTMSQLPSSARERWLRRQKGRIAKAYAAETYGVLVSTKTGQFSLGRAFDVIERLKSRGKRAFLFAGEELNPANLLPFRVDCWVNTACPRIVDDEFDKPVVNAAELNLV